MKTAMAKEEILIIDSRENRHPRSFDPMPALISFRAPGRDNYAFFARTMNAGLRNQILLFMAEKISFARHADLVKKLLIPRIRRHRWVNVGKFASKHGTGRSADAICSFVWSVRSCIVGVDEFVFDPLSTHQSNHVAYDLEWLDALLHKVGMSGQAAAAAAAVDAAAENDDDGDDARDE